MSIFSVPVPLSYVISEFFYLQCSKFNLQRISLKSVTLKCSLVAGMGVHSPMH